MFSYDAEKNTASIAVNPLEFNINELVDTIRDALDSAIRQCCSEEDFITLDDYDYMDLCNLVFGKAEYYKGE